MSISSSIVQHYSEYTSLSGFPRAICSPTTQSMTRCYKRITLNVRQDPGQKQHFTKSPPRPCSAAPPPPALFTALFRGGLILFHSLAVILSSVNLSFQVWDYAAEYQGNTNPDKVPVFFFCCSPPATPRLLPLYGGGKCGDISGHRAA